MAEGDTVVNALLGAVVSVVLSFLPFSPLLGGLLAGYLQGGDRRDGARAGALSGAIALVPIVGFLLLLGGLWGFLLVGGMPLSLGFLGVFLALLLLGVVAVWTVGLAALGGWLGNYVLTDTDLGRRPST